MKLLAKRVPVILLLLFLSSTARAQAQNLFFQPPSFSCNGAIVTADFKQDGKPDLVCADGTVLLGKGDGTFATGTPLSVTGNVIATGDFNSDGKPDLLVTSFGSTTLSVLLGKGDGTFQTAVSTNVGASLSSVVLADLNGDGRPDVVGIVSGTAMLVLLGKGDGTFAPGVTYPVLTNSVNIAAVGDFNGDGKIDIAVAAASGTSSLGPVGVLLGNGDGTFQTAITSTGVNSPAAIVAKDFNGDGMLDLVISDSTTGETFTLLGNGNGTFQTPSPTVPASGVLAVADLNGDGKPDLVVAGNPFVEVFLGNGDGTFASKGTYLQGEVLGIQSIVIADFNVDNKPDVATANTILLGNGDGSFQGNAAISLSNNNSGLGSAVTGDFNRDGISDIAVVSSNPSNVNIFLNDGTGKFSLAHAYVLPTLAGSLATADLNSDGKLDLLFTTADAVTQVLNLSVMLGNGDGTFAPPTVAVQGVQGPITPAGIADFNGDHIPDLAFDGSSGLTVYLGKGDGTFHSPVNYFAGSGPNSFVTADFNNDGIVDAAVASSAGLGILLGKGDGTFQPATFSNSRITQLLAAADLNGDGKADLIATINGNLQILVGNGDGTFTSLPGTNQPVGQFVSVGDVNGDKKLDLVTGHGVQVLLGNGDGTFGNPIEIVPFGNAGHVGGRGVAARFALLADFNGDKRLDVAFDVAAATVPATAGVVTLLNIVQPPAPDFSISATALAPATIAPGSSATSTVTAAAVGAFSGSVALSCTGLPSGATCSFAPSSLSAGSGTSTVTVATKAASQIFVLPLGLGAYRETTDLLTSFLLGLLAMLIVNLFLWHRDQQPRWVSVFTLGVLLWVGMVATACGGGSGAGGGNPGTLAGTYTITVSATFTSGSTALTHDTKLALTVQ